MQPFINIGFVVLFVLIIYRLIKVEMAMADMLDLLEEFLGGAHAYITPVRLDKKAEDNLKKAVEKIMRKIIEEDEKEGDENE